MWTADSPFVALRRCAPRRGARLAGSPLPRQAGDTGRTRAERWRGKKMIIVASTRDSACSLPPFRSDGRTAHRPASLPRHHPTTNNPRCADEACMRACLLGCPLLLLAWTRPAACDLVNSTGRRPAGRSALLGSCGSGTAAAAVMCRAASTAYPAGRGLIRSLASLSCHQHAIWVDGCELGLVWATTSKNHSSVLILQST